MLGTIIGKGKDIGRGVLFPGDLGGSQTRDIHSNKTADRLTRQQADSRQQQRQLMQDPHHAARSLFSVSLDKATATQ
jgi:hypothetical protein